MEKTVAIVSTMFERPTSRDASPPQVFSHLKNQFVKLSKWIAETLPFSTLEGCGVYSLHLGSALYSIGC
jgi:hypothetical protein